MKIIKNNIVKIIFLISSMMVFCISCTADNLDNLTDDDDNINTGDDIYSALETAIPGQLNNITAGGVNLAIPATAIPASMQVELAVLNEDQYVNEAKEAGLTIDYNTLESEIAQGITVTLGSEGEEILIEDNLILSSEIASITLRNFDAAAIPGALPASAIPGAIPGAIPSDAIPGAIPATFIKKSETEANFKMQAVVTLILDNAIYKGPMQIPIYLNESSTYLVFIIPPVFFGDGYLKGGIKLSLSLFAISTSAEEGVTLTYKKGDDVMQIKIDELETLSIDESESGGEDTESEGEDNFEDSKVREWHYPDGENSYFSPLGGDAFYSSVAIDNDGNVLVAWLEDLELLGNEGQVFMSEYRDGAWNHPSNLNDFISTEGLYTSIPRVAIDDNGNAAVIWGKFDSYYNAHLYIRERRNGAWGDPANFSGYSTTSESYTRYISYFSIDMDNDGNTIVAWSENNDDGNFIYVKEYRNGTWGDAIQLNTMISSMDLGSVAVDMDDSGNVIVAWEESNSNDELSIFKSEYRNGEWSNPTSSSDSISPSGSDVIPGSVKTKISKSQKAIIVWAEEDADSITQIYRALYDGSWQIPQDLSDNISQDSQHASEPDVAMDFNGNIIIVWYQSDGESPQIFKSEYRDNSWITSASLSDNISPDGTSAFNPRVAMDNRNNAIIVWEQSDGESPSTNATQIFKSEYRNGAWSHPATLSDNFTLDGKYANFPEIAMNGYGDTIIVWSQQVSNGSQQMFKGEYR